jgi:hypothetical protein
MTTQSSDDSGLHPVQDNRYMSTRLIVALTLLLGAAFTTSALVDPHRAASERSLYGAGTHVNEPAGVTDPSAVQDREVVASIASWSAETPSEKRPTQGSYDWEELWLPR